ncbi:MAG TPA: acyltransferase [Polyangia bacterium]|nr:acyltransferase [Polyangia bacterium]
MLASQPTWSLVPEARVRHSDRYFAWFDYLRILLAIGVFVTHAGAHPFGSDNFGNACVQVFFALSGFLIGGILLQSLPADLPRFYFNRSTRIWVPYAIAIGLLFAGSALQHQLHDPKVWEFFFYKATFVYNFFGPPQLARFAARMPLHGTGNHFWSICVEEQFYLFAPFLMVFLRRRRAIVVAALVAIVVLNFAYQYAFASVALGVLLAISRDEFGDWYLRPGGVALVVGMLGAAVGLVCVGCLSYGSAVPFAAVGVVALLARPRRPLKLGPWLGGISYPFYLDHWIGLFFQKTIVRHLHTGPVLTGIGAFAIAFTACAAHYRFIDSAIMARRAAWFTPRRGLIACCCGLALVALGLVVGVALNASRPAS